MASCLFGDNPFGKSGLHSRTVLDNSWLYNSSEVATEARRHNWVRQHAPQLVDTLRGPVLSTRFT
jgi:hypothetical protein